MDFHLHRAKIYSLFLLLARRFFLLSLIFFLLLLLGWPLIQKCLTFFSPDPSTPVEKLSVLENVMRSPHFVSKTHQGEPYEVKALQAKGTLEGIISLVQPKATLLKGEQTLTLSADHGQLQEKKGLLSLKQNVALEGSTGYRLETKQVYMDLKTRHLHGDHKVQASGSLGVASADGFTFKQEQNNNILVLKGHPHLVIQPAAKHR